jgi:hypothetical protein
MAKQNWTELEHEIMRHWHADGLSWPECRAKMLEARKRKARMTKIPNGTPGPKQLQRMFRL